jgi:signal transduction histidine kinase
LRGVKEGMKIQSKLGIPLEVGGRLQGMVMIASLKPDYFTDADEMFAKSAVRWVGTIAHRAELVEDIERNALELGRRAAAKELVTVLAHDIRNYIGPVSARLYALRHRAEKESREADLVDIHAAVRSIARLGDLVSNLLDVARIDRGLFELELEPVDLGALVKQAAEALATPDHGIVVTISRPVIVSGDPARIRQCLDNLITNAINHSPDAVAVNVFVSTTHRDGREWGQVEIVDEGPGIAQDVLPRLFDPFVTGRGQNGGLGLGLYLAKRIASAHGGDIEVHSAGPKGSRFLVRLPLYEQ